MSWLTNATVTSVADKDAQAKEASRQAAKLKCAAALQAITYTFTDGRVIQIRPQDRSNFKDAIALNVDQKWIMADNKTRLTTPAELQAVLDDGIAQGDAIYDQYGLDLDAI